MSFFLSILISIFIIFILGGDFIFKYHIIIPNFYVNLISKNLPIYSPLNLTSISFSSPVDNKFYTELRNAVSQSFDAYFRHCSTFDELRPATNECINEFGFSSTILESIETLYILSLTTQYKAALRWINSNFDCHSLGWVNRREIWSRGVGSLIGSYLLTKNPIFLSTADKCAKRLISIEKEHGTKPYVNMKLKLAKSLPWENTTSLVDMIAGLPEVISLRILTENTTYSLKSNSISGHLPMPKQFPLNPFYEGYDKPSTTHLFYDGLSDGFYQNLAISNQMRPIKAISRILESVYSNLTLLNSKENTLYVPVVDSISISIKDGIKVDQKLDAYKKLYGELKKSYRSPEFSIFTKAGSSNDIYVPFRFESSFIRTMIRENDISSEELINMFRKSLEICKVNDGFAGRLKINSGRVTSTNIQHSNFFGQWSSLAALIALGKENLIRKSVFNERGHILYSDMIIENNDDE